MATATFTLPGPHKLRTSTHRAYVLIAAPAGATPYVLRRSDSPETLVKVRRSRGINSQFRYYLGDTGSAEITPI